MRDTDGAILDYDQAIFLDPTCASVYIALGDAKAKKNDYDGANQDYDQAIHDLGLAIRLNSKNLEAYVQRARAKGRKRDYDGAIEDFDQVIQEIEKIPLRNYYESKKVIGESPWYASVYCDRGSTKYDNQDFSGAILDFNRAIQLFPRCALAFRNRGRAKFDLQDLDHAILDFDHAIQFDPKAAESYNYRGIVKGRKEDLSGAVSDYDKAIQLSPRYINAYFFRGIAKLVLHSPTAADDFQSVLDLENFQWAFSSYSVIFGTLAIRLQGDMKCAQEFLNNSTGKLNRNWPFPIIAYLNGELGETNLLEQATDTVEQTEARCYIAMNQLAFGRVSKAREHFQWVLEHGEESSYEYMNARAELQRLDAVTRTLESDPSLA